MVGAVGAGESGSGDLAAAALLARLGACGVRCERVRRVHGATTQVVSSVFSASGDLAVGVADTAVTEAGVDVEWVQAAAAEIGAADWVVLDANLDAAALTAAAAAAAAGGARVWLEPVSVAKAPRLAPALRGAGDGAVVSPNAQELVALARAAGAPAARLAAAQLEAALAAAGDGDSALPPVAAITVAAEALLACSGLGAVVTTMGAHGALLSERTGEADAACGVHSLAGVAPRVVVRNVSGAGDCQVRALHSCRAACVKLTASCLAPRCLRWRRW